jgi:uncharacterized membrane protein YccC
MTAVLLTQISFGRSLKATFDYIASTVAGAVYAGSVAALVPASSALELAGVLTLSVAPLALLGAFYPRFSGATVTGVLVLFLPGASHVSPIEAASYRVVEVALGGAAALVVSLLVFPTRARTLTIQAAVRMLDLAADSLPVLLAGSAGTIEPAEVGRVQDRIGDAFTQVDAAFAEARRERLGLLGAQPDPDSLLRALLRLRHDLVMIGRAGAEPLAGELKARLEPPLSRIATTAAEYLQSSAQALAHGRPPPSRDEVDCALDDCAEALARARRDNLTRRLSVEALERLFALGFGFEQLRRNLAELERCLREAVQER